MNKVKSVKFSFALTKILLMMFVFIFSVGCNDKGKNSLPNVDTTLSNDQLRTLNTLKLEDNYPLYSMHYYGNYYFEEYLKQEDPDKGFRDFIMKKNLYGKNLEDDTITKAVSDPAECSAFLAQDMNNAYLYGRNLDLTADAKHPGVLIYTNPLSGFASISMVELWVLDCAFFADDKNTLPPMEKRYNLLAAPFVPRDGLNEHGLAVSSLSAPQSEFKKDPSKKSIGRWQVNRLLLDHAKNVDEGVALIKKYNINMGDGSGVHYFLADKSGKSAVVEVVNGKVEVLYNKNTWNGVTNFLVTSDKKSGTGKDRYNKIFEVLKKKQGKLSEKESMTLLKDVSVKNKTVWSNVYNLTTGEMVIYMGRNYNKPIRFSFNPAQ